MKQKIILSLAILSLLSLAVFVYGYSPTILNTIQPSDSNYNQIVERYGPPSSEDIKDYTMVEINYPVKEGWNYIPLIFIKQADSLTKTSSCWDQSKLGTSNGLVFDETIFDYLYIYDENAKSVFPEYENNGYVGGSINEWTKSPLIDYYNNIATTFISNGYYSSIPVTWVHSPKDCTITYYAGIPNTEEKMKETMDESLNFLFNRQTIKLQKGWQMILMMTLGHSFDEIKGDCEIEEVNIWDSTIQRYNYGDEDEMRARVPDFLSTKVNSDIWLNPILIKVKDECTLSYSGGVQHE